MAHPQYLSQGATPQQQQPTPYTMNTNYINSTPMPPNPQNPAANFSYTPVSGSAGLPVPQHGLLPQGIQQPQVPVSAQLPPGAPQQPQPNQNASYIQYPQHFTTSAFPQGMNYNQTFINAGQPSINPVPAVSSGLAQGGAVPPSPQFIPPPFSTAVATNFPNQIMSGMLVNNVPSVPATPPYQTPPGLIPQPTMQAAPSIVPSPQSVMPNNKSYPLTSAAGTITQPPEIKLEIMAKNLRDRDTVTKSDPTCVVFMEDRRGNVHYLSSHFNTDNVDNDDVPTGESSGGPARSSIRWKEVDRTECLKNNLNPHFKVQITVPYVFEQLQHIKFGLWDIDSKKQTDLDSHDFLGESRTTIGELVMSGVWTSALVSPNAKDMKKLITGGKRDLGKITVIVHENRDAGNVMIKAHLAGRKLDRKDFGISSDPYFIVTQVGGRTANSNVGKHEPPTSRSQLYESEVIKRNVNPTWKPFHVRVAKPKGGDNSDMKLEFLVYDKDNHSRDDEIGKATLSVDQLEKTGEVALTNGRKQLFSKKQKVCGYLRFSNVRIIPMPSLVDYLQGGLKLHFSVAVDLTASNGNPNEPLSLHYCQDFYQGNQYTRALTAIASVLHVYAPPEQLFAAFGFGAVLPGAPGYTNSCFPLSLRPDPMCHGLQGILEAYVTALRTVKLSGPTNFAPLIDTVSRTAAQRLNTQTDQNYDILLILTDGVVSDFDLTVDQIISASHKAPLSIIIIGIGNRNFERMRDLDSDGKLLTSADGIRQAARDICQFVAFSDHEGQSPERLGAAVLAEVPGNIVEYFAGICNPPINPGRRQDHLSTLPYT